MQRTSKYRTALALNSGDKIGIAAPSTLLDKKVFQSAAEKLSGWGYPVQIDSRLTHAHGSFAGNDDSRADVLLRLFRDPDVRAIWCARGGYGVTRILSLLDRLGAPKFLSADPKLLFGYSDITALHLYAFSRAGLRSVHAPVLATPAWLRLPLRTEKILRKILAGEMELGERSHSLQWPTKLLHPLTRPVEARILGGNLTLIASLAGTPWQPSFDKSFLFFEDCGEAPYRLDRMIVQLKNSGMLKGLRGVLVGDVTADVTLKPGEKKNAWKNVLEDQFGRHGIPVLYHLPVGHGARNEPLPLGVQARISRDGKLSWLEPVSRR